MPQGDAAGAGDGAALNEKSATSKKKVKGRRHGAHVVHMTDNFRAAMPQMTANAEAMAAGKLLKSGALLRMNDVRASGAAELKEKALEARRKNPVTALLSKTGHIKGMRGDMDIDELAALDPALKSLLDHRKVSAGGRKRPAPGAEGAVSSSLLGSGAPNKKGRSASGGGGRTGGGTRKGRAEGSAGASAGEGGEALFATDAAVTAALGADFL
jgi:hypothetical protein